eukprot:gene4278-4532_t
MGVEMSPDTADVSIATGSQPAYRQRSTGTAGATEGTAFELRCPTGAFITYFAGGGLDRHIEHLTGICSDGTMLDRAGDRRSIAAFDSSTKLQVAAGSPEPGTFSFRSNAGFKSLKVSVGSRVESLSFQTLDNVTSPIFQGREAEAALQANGVFEDSAEIDSKVFNVSCAQNEKIVGLHGRLDDGGLVALGVACGRLRITAFDCPAGFRFTAGFQRTCLPCPAGTYSPGGRLGTTLLLKDLPSAKHVQQVHIAAYIPKPAALVPLVPTLLRMLQPGTYSDGKTATCIPCKAGTFSLDRASSCIACSPGTFSPQASNKCLECKPGTFAAQEGTASCTPAPIGHFVPQAAAKTSTACQPGYFSPSAGSTSCTPCGYSTYSDSPGSASCTTCPHSTHTPGVPAKSITECISEHGPTVDIPSLTAKAGPGSSTYLGLSPLLCKWQNLPSGVLNMCQKDACTTCVSFSPNPTPADAARAVARVLPSGGSTAPTDLRFIVRSTNPDAPQCLPPLVCTAVDELGNAAFIRYDELMSMVRTLKLLLSAGLAA